MPDGLDAPVAGSVCGEQAEPVALAAGYAPYLTVFAAVLARARAASATARPDTHAFPAGDIAHALGMPGLDRLPGFLLPPTAEAGADPMIVAGSLLRVGARTVAAGVQATWNGAVPGQWRPAVEQPRRWIRDLVHALRDEWRHTRVRWHADRYLIDREVERIGTAAVTGTSVELLESVHPGVCCDAGRVMVRRGHGAPTVVHGGRLTLFPTLDTTGRLIARMGAGNDRWIAYPALGLSSRARASRDGLAVLLGARTAAVVRALRRSSDLAELAAHVRCPVAEVEGICDRLEAAGLITRDRLGAPVRLMRTAIAGRLTELFDGLVDG